MHKCTCFCTGLPVDALYMVKNSPPPIPILCALNSPTHNKAAIEASTADPFLFKMSLQRRVICENTINYQWPSYCLQQTWLGVWELPPADLRTLPGVCRHGRFGVEMVRGRDESCIPDPQKYSQEKAQCSHKQDHHPSNKRLLDHFPDRIQNTECLREMYLTV